MNRYQNTFQRCAKGQRMAFTPFWMIGDPTLAVSQQMILDLAETSEVLELGIPFSDPLADGPIIQAASTRAIQADATIDNCLPLLQTIRDKHPQKPIGLLVYYNLIMRYGIESFFSAMGRVGVDSVLIPELSIEQSEPIRKVAAQYGVALVFIVSTNTQANRLHLVAQASLEHFIYVVSTPSATGSDNPLAGARMQALAELLQQLHDCGAKTMVGFGIHSAATVQLIGKLPCPPNGVIMGSALIARYQEAGHQAALQLAKQASEASGL